MAGSVYVLIALGLCSPVCSRGFEIPPSSRRRRDNEIWRPVAKRQILQQTSSGVKNELGRMDDEQTSTIRQRLRLYLANMNGMSIALSASYFTVMGAKCALPSVLSLLKDPSTGLRFAAANGSSNIGPDASFSRLLTLSTAAVALGKLLLGPVIDHFGGVTSLKVALGLLGALLATISCSRTFAVFSTAWIFVDFIFSSCWAACINAIHQCFPEKQWPGQIANLAASARTGNALAFVFFASFLQFLDGRMRQAWRPIFAVSALLQLVPLTLLSIFGGRKQATKSRPSVGQKTVKTNPLATLRREAATPDFWLHLISRSVLMVFASFLLFVPTLMSQVYRTSHATGSQVGALYALGCLLSVTTCSQRYASLSKRNKAAAVVGLLGLGLGSSVAQWGHMAGAWQLPTVACAALMFLWGFSFAIPFYIPPSLFALERGGVESSATIADVFDVSGFALLAAFNGYVAGLPHSVPSAWIPTFQMTSACSLISLIALASAALREKEK